MEKTISTINKNREQLANIAQETITILARGQYTNRHGKLVDIATAQQCAVAQSVYYPAAKLIALGSAGSNKYKTQFEVSNELTLSAARRIAQSGATKLLCLNFASAKNPGGGFLGGR